MPTIEEEDDTQETYSGDSDELDPFADSVEVEFGLNVLDSRLVHLHRQPPRPHVHPNRSSAPEMFGQYVHGEETHDTAPPPYESVVGSNSGNGMMPPQYVPPVYAHHYSPGYDGVQMPYGSLGFGSPQFPPGSTPHGGSNPNLGFGPPQFPPGSTPHGGSNPDPEGMIPKSSSTPLMEAYTAQGRELRHRSSDSSHQYH